MVPMALSIKSDVADQLARELAELTGESITEAVTNALRTQLDRERRSRRRRRSALDIAAEFQQLPDLDRRTGDEILGYDQHGLPN